jgi:hypothetical protein
MATGVAEGTDVAVGASLALSMIGDLALAYTERSVTAGGSIGFRAEASGGSRSEAKSSSKGGKKKTDRETAASTPGSKEPENVDQEAQTQRSGTDAAATSRAPGSGAGRHPVIELFRGPSPLQRPSPSTWTTRQHVRMCLTGW